MFLIFKFMRLLQYSKSSTITRIIVTVTKRFIDTTMWHPQWLIFPDDYFSLVLPYFFNSFWFQIFHLETTNRGRYSHWITSRSEFFIKKSYIKSRQ